MRPTLEKILDTTLEVLNVPKDVFERERKSREKDMVKVKQILCYVGQEYGYSQPKIGAFLSLNHSTVHHNKETAKGYAKYEPDYANEIKEILSRLKTIEDIEDVYVMNGQIIRDDDGFTLFVVDGKPFRMEDGIWLVQGGVAYNIPKEAFPQITWDNEPQECEMILRLK